MLQTCHAISQNKNLDSRDSRCTQCLYRHCTLTLSEPYNKTVIAVFLVILDTIWLVLNINNSSEIHRRQKSVTAITKY